MTSAIDITQSVKPPRAVFVNFPLGHQTGPPDQPELQRKIVTDAMRAFETIACPYSNPKTRRIDDEVRRGPVLMRWRPRLCGRRKSAAFLSDER